MAATAIHHTFSVRPAHSAPEFIPFDPSRLAVKPPRTHHRKRKPNVDPSPHIPWVDIDEIVPKKVYDNIPELDLTGPEPGSQSPEHRPLPATTLDIDRTQIDTGGRSGFTQREGDGNRSRSPIPLDTREDGGSTPLKGSSLDEPFVIEDNGSDDESECENELPSRTSLFEREVGLNSERGPLQADHSAQSAPEATLPDPRAEDIGESDGDDDDVVDDNSFLGLTDGQLRQNFEADERIVSSQAHGSAMQSDQAVTTAGHSQSPEPEGGADLDELGTDSHRNHVGVNRQSVRAEKRKRKRKRSLSTDPNESVVQTPDSIRNGEDNDNEIGIDDVYDSLDGESNADYPVDDDHGSRHSFQVGQRQRSVTSTWQQTPSSSRANSADPKPAKKRRQHHNSNNPASGDVHTRSRHFATSPRRPQTVSASAKSRGLAIDRVGTSPQDPLYKVIDITLRPVLTGVSFLAATIQSAGDSIAFSHNEPATLLNEVLGQGGKIEGVTLKPLPSSRLWMMTGFRRVDVCDRSGLIASSETRPADVICSSGSLEQRARALCNLAADTKAGEAAAAAEEEEEGVSDSGFGASDDDDGAGRAVYRGIRRLRAQTRRPWKPLDEQRLLAWKRENKSWKWIFSQFPDRTPGAIRTRVNMLQTAVRSRRSQTAEVLED